MNRTLRLGSIVFGLAMLAFGIQHFVYNDFVLGLIPVLAPAKVQAPWVYLTGAALIAAGLSLVVNRMARASALLMALLWFLCFALLHVDLLRTRAQLGGEWTNAFEALAFSGAALVLAAALSAERSEPQRWERILASLMVVGRIAFAIGMPIYGIQHFKHDAFIAPLIPAWLPLERLFWVHFTGVAHIAAGLSIASTVLARWGALALSLMFGLWVLVLHIPRVLTMLQVRSEWTSAVVALAMCGGALIIAGALPKENWERLVKLSAGITRRNAPQTDSLAELA